MTHYKAIVLGKNYLFARDFGEDADAALRFETEQMQDPNALHSMSIGDMNTHVSIYYYRDKRGNLVL